ncbi:KxYKxGKxW signal peptide domain-containing protein [Lactobacillus delbrueckii]
MTTVTSKSHFRTWKSGKSWLFATSALAGLMSNIFQSDITENLYQNAF